MMQSQPSHNDRLMAALAHGSVVLSGSGLIVGVLIWLTQKEKSPYAAAQALQAAVYQLLGLVVIVALWIIYGVLVTIATIPLVMDPAQYENAPPPPFFWVSMAFMLVPFAVMMVWGLYGLWGALKCWRGHDFRYAVIGRRLMQEQSE